MKTPPMNITKTVDMPRKEAEKTSEAIIQAVQPHVAENHTLKGMVIFSFKEEAESKVTCQTISTFKNLKPKEIMSILDQLAHLSENMLKHLDQQGIRSHTPKNQDKPEYIG